MAVGLQNLQREERFDSVFQDLPLGTESAGIGRGENPRVAVKSAVDPMKGCVGGILEPFSAVELAGLRCSHSGDQAHHLSRMLADDLSDPLSYCWNK